jgi:Tfp pilus assembly major pilin PilA
MAAGLGAAEVPKQPVAKPVPPTSVAATNPQVPPGPTVEKPPTTIGRPGPFSPEMSAEFMQKVMETTAKIEAIKKKIAERQAVIYETNPQVKECRSQLIEMQHEINKILEADAELATLKLNRDILWTTMPTLPRGNSPGGPTRGFGPLK